MKNSVLKASLLILVLALVVPGYVMAADSGAQLFASKCAMCHGKAGAANTPMAKNMKIKPFNSDDVQKQQDTELKITIEKGKGKMPAYGTKLSSTQIDDLVKYIRSLKK